MDGMKFRIGAVDYEIKEVADLHDKGEELLGWVTYNDCLIRIDSASSNERKRNVIIHELLHAMLYEAGYDEQDEEMVRRLGNVLAQVLRDNDFGFMRNKKTEIEIVGDDGYTYIKKIREADLFERN